MSTVKENWFAPLWMELPEADARNRVNSCRQALQRLSDKDSNYGRSISHMLDYWQAVLDITEHFAHLAKKRTPPPSAPAAGDGAEGA